MSVTSPRFLKRINCFFLSVLFIPHSLLFSNEFQHPEDGEMEEEMELEERINPLKQLPQISPFALITIPKSGSHMAIKALHFLTGVQAVWHTRFPSLFYVPSDEGFLYTHFCLSPELEDDYFYLPNLKKVIMIRDLRDVCISIVHQIRKAPWPGMNEKIRKAFLDLSFEEQLHFVIDYDYDVHEVADFAPNSIQTSVLRVAKQAEKYCQDHRNLVCRYENLVGPMGGGSEEAQILEITRIAEHLEIPMSEDEIYMVASNLYGNTVDPFGKEGFEHFGSTFRRGQIGRWKAVFNEDHKRAFKSKLGDALIALGYEDDCDW